MKLENRPINISITTGTVVKVIFVIVMLYFLFLIKDIVAILFVSLIFASAIDPWVDWMQSKKVPRSVSVLLIYIVLLSIVSLTVYLIIPPIVKEVSQLSQDYPRYVDKAMSGLNILKNYSVKFGVLDSIKSGLESLSSNFQTTASGVFSTVTGFIGKFFSFFLILVMTFYMTVEENAIKKLVYSIAPNNYRKYIMQLIGRMQKKIGLWLRGQLILCLIIFIFVYIGLSILGVQYALVLALIAGLMEFIPYIGPVISVVPAAFIAFTQSPMLALFVIPLYYLIQWLENNILVPKIMQKTTGINPIVSISALLIGYKLAGILGAILGIPVATAISVFFTDLFEGREMAEEE